MKKSGNTNRRAEAGPDDWKKYQEAWSKMMVEIWQEKIERLKVIDTHRLHHTIDEKVIYSNDAMSTIQHKFLEYGFYQDCGTGRGYKANNPGSLEFLDPEYRYFNNLDEPRKRGPKWGGGYTSGHPRKPREWFSRAYFASVMVLREEMAYIFGEEFCGLVADAVEATERKKSTSLRSALWGHHARGRHRIWQYGK